MRSIGAIIFLLLAFASTCSAAGANRRVLVVHDSIGDPESAEQEAVAAMLDLLGHFECSVTALPAQDYREGQLADYDATIYLGLREGADLPRSLLADCYDSDRPICWLGANIEQLADDFSLGRYGFRLLASESASRPERVSYRGTQYRRASAPVTEIAVAEPDVCRVLAEMRSNGERLPYAVRSGDFWYFAELPLRDRRLGGTHLILSDQLHEILGESHLEQTRALVCITGVQGETEVGPLAELITYFERSGVPFAISMAPRPLGDEADGGTALSEQRGLVGVLRGAQANGASVIAHALDGAGSRDERGQSAGGVSERFESALAEMERCGLYPVAWASPADGLSREERAEMAALFSTVWGVEEGPGGAVFPFLGRGEAEGQRIIPDNLALLREGRGEAEEALAEARRHAAVSDAWVTVGIGPDASLSSVEVLVRGLRQLGYEFADLRRMGNWTKGESLHVHSVASPVAAAELIPEGWCGTLMDTEGREDRRFERPGKDEREEAQVLPGALLLAYPAGEQPRPMFVLEGGAGAATGRMVYAIARAVSVVGIAACGLLMLIYLVHTIMRRRA